MHAWRLRSLPLWKGLGMAARILYVVNLFSGQWGNFCTVLKIILALLTPPLYHTQPLHVLCLEYFCVSVLSREGSVFLTVERHGGCKTKTIFKRLSHYFVGFFVFIFVFVFAMGSIA